MRCNVGKTDKVVRVLLGLVLVAVLFLVEGPVRYVGLLGIVLLATVLMSFCPLYMLFGMNTCAPSEHSR